MKERDIPVTFNLSIQTQVNEYDSDRHMKATYEEFLEAISRAIDMASWLSDEEMESGDLELTSVERRKGQTLIQKLEVVKMRIFQNCLNNRFKEKYAFPQVDV